MSIRKGLINGMVLGTTSFLLIVANTFINNDWLLIARSISTMFYIIAAVQVIDSCCFELSYDSEAYENGISLKVVAYSLVASLILLAIFNIVFFYGI